MDLSPEQRPGGRSPGVLELLQRIGDDLKVIGKDEIALARLELGQLVKKTAADAGAIVLGGVVALIGLGLLCGAAVAALEPWLEPLWLRMVLMAGIYLLTGASVAASFAKRLKRDLSPQLPRTVNEAKRTVQTVKRELSHA